MFFEKFECINLISILVQFGFSTATLIYCALVPLGFLLLIAHPTKPLSPGGFTHWSIFVSWNNAIYLLSKTEVLQNLH